jgi:hypothetical protein
MSDPTQSTLEVEYPPITPDRPARVEASAEAKRAFSEKQSLETIYLDVGVKVYPDRLPGVGWVLDRVGYVKRYLKDKDSCISHYWQLVRRGEV